MGEGKCVVMDGRDIGTVVFPNAELKIFVTASSDVRAKRRYDELVAKGDAPESLEKVKKDIEERDLRDTTRKESPLVQAADAVVLDNSDMTLEEQFEWLKRKFDETVGK
jgi:cytidylate kinase